MCQNNFYEKPYNPKKSFNLHGRTKSYNNDCQSKPIASYKSCLGKTSRKRKVIILRYPLFTKTMFGSDLKNLVNPKRLVHNTEL